MFGKIIASNLKALKTFSVKSIQGEYSILLLPDNLDGEKDNKRCR